jgi:Isochorismatase family
MVFLGDLFGFVLGAELHLADLGWLSAEIVIGAGVACIVQFTLFYPNRSAALRRAQKSYKTRERAVAGAGLDLLLQRINPGRASDRLDRRLIRLNERTWGAFHNTALDAILQEAGATQVVITGVATSAGVESTARAAHEHGYHVVLAVDAMTDMAEDAHQHSVEQIFPRIGETATTEEVLAAVRSEG